MSVGDEDSLKRLNVVKVDRPTTRQAEYMNDVKGLLECDLLSISSSSVCMLRNNGTFECYVIREDEERDYEEFDDLDQEEADAIEEIEKAAEKVFKKVDPATVMTKIPTDIVYENEAGDEDEEVDIKELENADNIEKLENADTEEKEELIFDEGETSSLFEQETEYIEHETTRDNSLPTNLEDDEVQLGLIYVLIDLSTFFKKVSTLENDILDYYDQLEENEVEMRDTRMVTIKDLSNRLEVTTSERLTKIKEEELALKSQLLRLTLVLSQTEKLKTRTNDPKKFSEIIPEIDAIYHRTRKTIHDLNIQLLRLRDEADEMLTAYQSFLEELLGVE